MVRIGASTGTELLSGDSENVMATYDGRAVLRSRNQMPNPDFADLDADGMLEGWELYASPRSDGWGVAARRLTTINGAGNHVPARETSLQKQHTAKLSLRRSRFAIDSPLINGGRPKGSAGIGGYGLAAPDEAPVVRVRAKTGAIGLAAGTYPVAWCKVMGDPKNSSRISGPSPVSLVTVTQGGTITCYLPEESALEDGVTGLGILLGEKGSTDQSTLRLHDVLETDAGIPSTYVIKGPRHRRGPLVTPAQGNKTALGSEGQHPQLLVKTTRAQGDLGPTRNLRVSYSLKTPQGASASQAIRSVQDIAGRREGEALLFRLPASVAKQLPKGAEWRFEFTGMDGNWHALSRPGAPDGFASPGTHALLYTNDTGEGSEAQTESGTAGSARNTGWRGIGPAKPVQIERATADESGVPDPDAALEDPIQTPGTAAELAPGRFAVRCYNTRDGEESALSAPATFVLRDAGLAGGGAASGVTDQVAFVYRPGNASQKIQNERWFEKDSSTGELDLDWDNTPPANVLVSYPDGGILFTDTSNATTAADLKTSFSFPVDPTKLYALRLRLKMDSRAGGSFQAQLLWLKADGTQIDDASRRRDTLEEVNAAGEVARVRTTIGAEDSGAELEIPPQAVQAQLVFRAVGAAGAGNARNFAARVTQLGLWRGRATNRKRYPLGFGLEADNSSSRPASGTEADADPYPVGPFCHVVEDPEDGAAQLVSSVKILEKVNFEDGADPATWTKTVTPTDANHSMTVSPAGAISGDFGVVMKATAAGAQNTNLRYSKSFAANPDVTSAKSIGLRLLMRFPRMLTSNNANVLSVSTTVGPTDHLARINVDTAGTVTLFAKNGASETSIQVVTGAGTGLVRHGTKVVFDLITENYGTASGKATARVKVGERPWVQVQLTSLDWASVAIGSVLAGMSQVPLAALFKAHMDSLTISVAGLVEDAAPIPGNAIEYWAPDGTPYTAKAFATGMRVPVKPDTAYVDSVFAGCEGVAKAASLFKAVVRDKDHNVLSELPYLVPKLKGQEDWERHFIAYTTPADAAYLHYTRNNVADGLIRAMGMQHEERAAALGPSAFTNQNASSGFVSVRLDTRTPAGAKPAKKAVSETANWLRARAVVSHEVDGSGNPLTSHTYRIRAAETEAALASAVWCPGDQIDVLVAQLGFPPGEALPRFAEIRVDLATTDLTKSPELRGLYLEVERKLPVLLRPDGTELPGGAVLFGVSPDRAQRPLARPEYADGTLGMWDLSRGERPPRRLVFSVQMFERDAADEFHELQGANEGDEDWVAELLGRRYLVSFAEAVAEAGEEDLDEPGRALDYVAEGIEAVVTGRGPL